MLSMLTYRTSPRHISSVKGCEACSAAHVGAVSGTNEPSENNLGRLLSMAGAGLGAYHGYRRNESIGWAIGWAVAGSWFPVITTGVALAQGFGEKAP